jgi:hypothetical protein
MESRANQSYTMVKLILQRKALNKWEPPGDFPAP